MRGSRAARAPGECGSGTLLAVSVMLLLLTAGLVSAVWVAVSLAHHQAVAAADLAAVSAARALVAADDPCGAAAEIAARHRADLLRCDVSGDTVEVVAAVRLGLGALGSPEVPATARAGPVAGS